MTKPLTAIMWAPAFKAGTRWALNAYMLHKTRKELVDHVTSMNPVKEFRPVKVRITEVQTAGYSPSRR